MRKPGKIVAALVVSGVALMAPATAGAATTLGQLRVIPQGIADCDPGKVYVQRTSTGSIRYQVPAGGGVITSWATRPGLNPNQQAAFKVVRDNGGNSFTVVATSAAQNLNSQENVDTFAVRIPVQAGDFIAYSPTVQASQQCIIDNTGAGNDTWSGTSAADVGATFPVTNEYPGRSLNLQATLEPDADKDGFGDETQDRCPSQAGTTGTCSVAGGNPPPPPDKTKPTFGSLSFSRTAFAAAKSGSAFSSQRKAQAPGRHQGLLQPVRGGCGQVHRPAQDHRPEGQPQVQDPHTQEPQEGQVHAVEERPRLVHVHRQGRQELLHLPRPHRRQGAQDRWLPPERHRHRPSQERLDAQEQAVPHRQVAGLRAGPARAG